MDPVCIFKVLRCLCLELFKGFQGKTSERLWGCWDLWGEFACILPTADFLAIEKLRKARGPGGKG